MEQLGKSKIVSQVTWALNHSEDLNLECILKNTNQHISVKITIKEQETFVDAKGIKWVRA